MRAIEKLIPEAIQIITEVGIAKEDLTVDTEFKGYVASFGASIVQSGLLPAVIFFENEESRSQSSRQQVPMAVLLLMLRRYDKDAPFEKSSRLSQYILESSKKRSRLIQEIREAVIALKIALRTFNLKKVASS